MSWIRDRCYFCLNKRAEHVVEDGELVINLCPTCKEQYDEAVRNSKLQPSDLPRLDPSALCIQCGLCCVMLVAKVEEEEVHTILEQADKAGIYPQGLMFPQFCTRSERAPYAGSYTINMPCRYLSGRVLSHVNCRAYKIDRPKVCKSYLCKIAIRYRLGTISITEALFLLRSSFLKGDVSIFNWDQSGSNKEDQRLDLTRQLADMAARLRQDGFEDQYIEFALCSRITPVYEPRSTVTHTVFNMHMANVDREDYNLEAFYLEDEIQQWSPDRRNFALSVIEKVLTELRALFKRKDEGPGDGEGEDRGSKEGGDGGTPAGGDSGDHKDSDEGDERTAQAKGETIQRGAGLDHGARRQPGDASSREDPEQHLAGEAVPASDPQDQHEQHPQDGSGGRPDGSGGGAEEGRVDHLKVCPECRREFPYWDFRGAKISPGPDFKEMPKLEILKEGDKLGFNDPLHNVRHEPSPTALQDLADRLKKDKP